jgi:hypothetical protein
MLPEIVKRAMSDTVTDIGQLTSAEIKTLDAYVKKGYLSKGKSGPYPVLKTVWACPGYDFDKAREAAVNSLLAECESLGERVTITFETGKE